MRKNFGISQTELITKACTMRRVAEAMYEEYFGFARKPFSRDIDVKQLYLHEDFQELRSRLKYSIENRLFAAVTGEVGIGKTTALRAVMDEVNPASCKAIYIAQSDMSPKSFYNEILEQLEINPVYFKPESKRKVNKAVMDLYQQGKIVVVIIDEAHLLSEKMLEEVRFLVNFRMDSLSPLSLVLVGQPELSESLDKHNLRAISQRITVRYVLKELDLQGAEDYIRTHIKFAGSGTEFFTSEAIKEIHLYSCGIPRKINLVCDKCLLDCFARKTKIVDDIVVKRVIKSELSH
jgi:general secretion pathway protein A